MELALSRPGSDSGSIVLRGTLLLYIVALIGADAAALVFSAEVSLACYAALLFVILTQLALFSSEAPDCQAALTGLALVATLKIGAVALPQRLVPEVYWDAFPAALALIVVIALVRIGPASPGGLRPPRPLPRREWWPQLVIAAAGPAIAIGAAYVLAAIDSSLARPLLVSRPPSVLIVAAFSGLMLEVVFRGCPPALPRPLVRPGRRRPRECSLRGAVSEHGLGLPRRAGARHRPRLGVLRREDPHVPRRRRQPRALRGDVGCPTLSRPAQTSLG